MSLTFVSGPQPHLVKCFENIKQLLIWKQEIGPPAVKMLISAEGEALVLPKYGHVSHMRHYVTHETSSYMQDMYHTRGIQDSIELHGVKPLLGKF